MPPTPPSGLDDQLRAVLVDAIPDPDGPGCVLGVIHDGALRAVVARGQANLEHRIPIRRETVFHVASVSKQFVAYAVLLLAGEGRLRLDDPVPAHLDWFPFPDITLRQLLHHTSGLRDQWLLTVLSGRRAEDVVTTDDVIDLVRHQRELNFPPGSEHSYSNTGYTLLGLVVEAVTGRRLGQFCAERIFGPLGMGRTRFLEDYHDVIADRADSYFAGPNGFRRLALSYSTAGATNLNTTVDDLARWAGHVMTPTVLASLRQRSPLTGGETFDYAMGVRLGGHRGRPTVGHSGGDAGFRAHVLILPEEGIAAIALANSAELVPGTLVKQAVDAVLGEIATDEAVAGARAEWHPDPAVLTGLAGHYIDPAEHTVHELRALDDGIAYHIRGVDLRLAPTRQGVLADEKGYGFEIEVADDGIGFVPEGRRTRRWRRLDPDPQAPDTSALPGWFHSPELRVSVWIEPDPVATDGGLRLQGPIWGTIPLRYVGERDYVAPVTLPAGTLDVAVSFDADGAALTLSAPRVRRVRFTRVARQG